MTVKPILSVILSVFLIAGFIMTQEQEKKEMEEVTTNSTEALNYYNEGRKHHLNGDYQKSIPLMEKAISIDPEFAMAFRSLGSSYINIGGRANWEKGIEYLKKAWEIAEKSERITHKEKLTIQGQFYQQVEGDLQKAGKIYEKLVEEFPEDQLAHDFMGYYAFQTQDWDLAIQHYAQAVKYGTNHFGVFDNLGFSYCANGLYEKAREIYRTYIAGVSDDVRMHRNIINSFIYEGKYEEASEAADKVIASNPNAYSKASIYHLQGDFEAAERGYKGWLEKNGVGWKMNGRQYLEMLYRMLGQYGKAREEAQLGLKFAEEINHRNWGKIFYDRLAIEDLMTGNMDGAFTWAEKIWDGVVEDEIPEWQAEALWLKLEAKVGQNNIEEALALAEEVKKIVDKTPSPKDIARYLSCMGSVEAKKNNYKTAIDLFSQAYSLIGCQRTWLPPHGLILFNLASAYYLNGDLEAAEKEYVNILGLTTGRLFWGDLYVKSFYMLGKIHEQQGNKAKAMEHYEKFLGLWKDADPGISEVEDARKRLSGLKGS